MNFLANPICKHGIRVREGYFKGISSVQAFLYLTSAGPGFLCRAPMLISISIPIYPQLVSLSLMISIRACSFFTFATSPAKCCLCAVRLLRPAGVTALRCLPASWLYFWAPNSALLLSPSYGISMESRLLPPFLASFPTIPPMSPVLRSAPNLLTALSHRILSFSWLCTYCPFSVQHRSPIFPSE